MSVRCLRPGLPSAYAFQVTELPHRAKLDQNETPVDLPDELKRDLVAELAAQPWNRYIQPADYGRARAGLAEVFGLDPDTIAITVGADQAIEAAFLVAGGPGRRARWFEPTYPYIPHAALRTSTEADPVVFGADVDARIDAAAVTAGPRADLIALVSPNNPTGGMVSTEVIDAALADDSHLVLLDEAYADYSGATEVGRIPQTANLLVVRSLSKSSLAGIHVGFAVAHPDVVRVIDRMYTAPYHLDAMQLLVARRYPEIRPHVEAAAARAVAERDRLATELAALPGITPRPSRASFILFQVAGDAARARAIHGALAEAGVRVRDVGGLPGLAGYLRVTIGTPTENALFLEELDKALSPRTRSS